MLQAAPGFGLLTVKTLAQKGHSVYATMRNVNTSNALATKFIEDWATENKYDVRVVELDVTSDESVHKAVTQIVEEAGRIDVLVNNAGLFMWGLSETLSTKQLEQVFQVNVFAADRMNKAVLPYMHKQNEGLLIHLSSGLSRLHLPFLGAYSAAKTAIDALAETLSYELKETNIDSIIIQPGAYPTTDLLKKMAPADSPLAAQQYEPFGSKIKQGVIGLFAATPQSPDPEEVAQLIAEIIELPKEERTLWTAVGAGAGQTSVEAINESTYQFSQHVQEALGIHS